MRTQNVALRIGIAPTR